MVGVNNENVHIMNPYNIYIWDVFLYPPVILVHGGMEVPHSVSPSNQTVLNLNVVGKLTHVLQRSVHNGNIPNPV